MKSSSAFEFTVRKMLRQNPKLYFWTFTFREVHSLKSATGFWNQFLTLAKRKLGFRGVRVLELHADHGCHFHVLTNRRYSIREIQKFKERYGFGRIDARHVPDSTVAVSYLCKYLSKQRDPCLRGVRLWSAFGPIERTRVRDVLIDTATSRLLRAAMGKPSVQQVLAGLDKETVGVGRFQPERNFVRALERVRLAYMLEFDPSYAERQAIWSKARSVGLTDISHAWSNREICALELRND
jgi:hypothetical protein